MNPSPTFLESLKPQERYELLHKARGDHFVGALSRSSSACASSRSRSGSAGKQASTAGRRLPGKRVPHSSRSAKGLSDVTSARQGTSSVLQSKKHSQGAQAIQALDSAAAGVVQERGNNRNRTDVSVCRPPAELGCTQELQDWTETLSKDNVALASEVMQLRTMLAAEKENGCVLGSRVDKLQDLYVESFVDQDSLHSTRQSALNAKLEALATPEVLAITRPPATFPVPVPHEQQCSNPSALQVERLRRHLVSVQTTLSSVVKERDSLAEQSEDSQAKRKAEKAAYQKQAAALQTKMLGTMRRLVYAADQISKKDESIKSLSGYIHRLEQQTLLLRRTNNKKHARTARRCHSQDTRTVRNQAHSSDSAGSSDCNPPQARLPFAGSQIHPVASCTHKQQHRTHGRSASPQLVFHDEVDQQQRTHKKGALEQSGQLDHVPVVRNSGVLDAAAAYNASAPASRQCQPSEAQTTLHDRCNVGRDSPINNNSYALQLHYAREHRQQSDNMSAVQCSQHESPRLTPIPAGELSVEEWHSHRPHEIDVGAWNSPSVVSAAGASGEMCEQPSLDNFGGTFGTRPDFTADNPVRGTADSETWQTYMAAIDEMEQRINALDFPPDVDTNLMSIPI